jgi:hypothetical protein
MAIDIEESVNRASFENRLASGYVDGEYVEVKVRVGDNKYDGEPYIVAGTPANWQYERFRSLNAAVEAFERIKGEYGLSE